MNLKIKRFSLPLWQNPSCTRYFKWSILPGSKDIHIKELKITFGKPIYYEQYSKMNREELSEYVYQKIKSHLNN